MIVQFVLKGLFFYFLFLFVRSFFKGMKEGEREQVAKKKSTHAKKSGNEDVVEADFRRL